MKGLKVCKTVWNIHFTKICTSMSFLLTGIHMSRVDMFRDLGVLFDTKLSFSFHVNAVSMYDVHEILPIDMELRIFIPTYRIVISNIVI